MTQKYLDFLTIALGKIDDNIMDEQVINGKDFLRDCFGTQENYDHVNVDISEEMAMTGDYKVYAHRVLDNDGKVGMEDKHMCFYGCSKAVATAFIQDLFKDEEVTVVYVTQQEHGYVVRLANCTKMFDDIFPTDLFENLDTYIDDED